MDMIDGIEPTLGVAGQKTGPESPGLKRVCSQFESLFIASMLKSMRKTVEDGGLIRESNEGKIYKSMFDEKLALSIADSGGIGLGAMLFEQLKGRDQGLDKQLPPT
jgi:flagellar protein FlgJ